MLDIPIDTPCRLFPPSSSVNAISNLAVCVVSLKLIPIETVVLPPPDAIRGIAGNS